jgi:hypothetical protein
LVTGELNRTVAVEIASATHATLFLRSLVLSIIWTLLTSVGDRGLGVAAGEINNEPAPLLLVSGNIVLIIIDVTRLGTR